MFERLKPLGYLMAVTIVLAGVFLGIFVVSMFIRVIGVLIVIALVFMLIVSLFGYAVKEAFSKKEKPPQ